MYFIYLIMITYCSLMRDVSVNWVIIGSGNGLSLFGTNADELSIGSLGTNICGIWIIMQSFLPKECIWECHLENVYFVQVSTWCCTQYKLFMWVWKQNLNINSWHSSEKLVYLLFLVSFMLCVSCCLVLKNILHLAKTSIKHARRGRDSCKIH